MDKAIVDQLFPRALPALAAAFAGQADQLFARYEITPGNRLDFFLAQIGHESAGLTSDEERLDYRAERLCQVWPKRFPTVADAQPYAHNREALAEKVYGGRLGNVNPGDGWKFRGRGLIQITGRDDYAAVTEATGINVLADPGLAIDPSHALEVACGFWKWKRINAACDANDFRQVTILVNGATVGLPERQAWLDKVRRILGAPPAIADQPPAEVVVAVQRELLRRGYREVGAADGLVGPRTLSAIARLRTDNGLPPGGIDAQLLAFLHLPVEVGV